jgi:hypothetical protein
MWVIRLIYLLFILLPYSGFSQCNGAQSFTLSPTPPAGGYTPGTVVTVCYTMTGYTMTNSNWLEGFDLTLGPGWTGFSPVSAPANCGGNATGGQWVWVTTTTSSATGTIAGPGYFFDLNSDGNPGNDFGDQGNCTWSFCFSVTVVNICSPQNLLIQVTAGGDGTWGSWTNNSCTLTPFTIYNGLSSVALPTLGLINHN